MAKIKINSLPKGFELKNGKVVKKMQLGGRTLKRAQNGIEEIASNTPANNDLPLYNSTIKQPTTNDSLQLYNAMVIQQKQAEKLDRLYTSDKNTDAYIKALQEEAKTGNKSTQQYAREMLGESMTPDGYKLRSMMNDAKLEGAGRPELEKFYLNLYDYDKFKKRHPKDTMETFLKEEAERKKNDSYISQGAGYNPYPEIMGSDLVKKYNELKFDNPDVYIGEYSSSDIVHPLIKPVGTYYDGIANSPLYAYPKSLGEPDINNRTAITDRFLKAKLGDDYYSNSYDLNAIARAEAAENKRKESQQSTLQKEIQRQQNQKNLEFKRNEFNINPGESNTRLGTYRNPYSQKDEPMSREQKIALDKAYWEFVGKNKKPPTANDMPNLGNRILTDAISGQKVGTRTWDNNTSRFQQGGEMLPIAQQGGSTGDQSGYGLATTPDLYNQSESSNDVRYSLSSVPRDVANIEAEGGETVLTDLNGSGQFGLYNIKGPRHSSGGVPMFLPEQSFIFSDTNAMKFNKNELAEFGIESKKKMTPAQVSKKYQLNKFIGALDNADADNITVKSAELMLDKNMNSLSKLAFGQEAKKNFSDGVPLAAYPFIVNQGQDPIEFTAKVEQMTEQAAAKKAIGNLSPEQQQQLMMMAQQSQMQPQAKDGYELPKAPLGGFMGVGSGYNENPISVKADPADWSEVTDQMLNLKKAAKNDSSYASAFLEAQREANKQAPLTPAIFDNPRFNPNANPFIPYANNTNTEATNTEQPGVRKRNVVATDSNDPNSDRNVAWSPERIDFYKKLGIDVNTIGVNALQYDDVQSKESGQTGLYGDASQNLEGFKQSWEGLYPEMDTLIESLSIYDDNENPEVKKFQKWLNEDYIPAEVSRIKDAAIESGEKWDESNTKALTNSLLKDYGFNPNKRGKAYDGLMGTFTSSRRPIGYTPVEKLPVEKSEDEIAEIISDVEPDDVTYPNVDPEMEYYTQDLMKMGALAMRDRNMFLPWQPAVEIPKTDYVLEEPTRALADTNERYNIVAQAIGAFAGPQSLNARLAQAQGNAFRQNANTFAQVHSRNVNTVNRGKAQNAQFEAAAKAEQRNRSTKLFDDTQLTLQNFTDEKNLDREQMADLQANALTNAANTYTMNTLYPYYNINPLSGGAIEWADNAPKLSANKAAAQQQSLNEQRVQRAINLEASGLETSTVNKILDLEFGTPSAAANNSRAATYNQGALNQGYQGKKGKEIKKYAVPFYTGKVGY